MNLQEFIEEFKLAASELENVVAIEQNNDPIRFVYGNKLCCPITAVCYMRTKEIFPMYLAGHAGRNLGLSEDEVSQIIAASDCNYGYHSFKQELRDQFIRIAKGEEA